MTAATIQERLDAAPLIANEGPRPLYRELPPSPAFPLGALGDILGMAARSIEAVVQCPLSCAANSVLAGASLAAQGRANVILPIGQGKPAPLGLYLLTVLESGERKSTADGMALKPVRDFEQEIAKGEASAREAYATKAAAHEAHIKYLTTQHKKDRAKLESLLREAGPAPQPPLISIIAPSGDQTMEGLFRIYERGRPSLAILCDDAASFLGGHSMKAEQKGATTANLCRAWDGAKLERIRGGDGVIILYDRRLAAHLMVQPGVAADFLSDRQFADQGLIARFLLSAPTGRAGTRFRDAAKDQESSRRAAGNLEGYNEAVTALLSQPVRWKDENDRALGVEMDALHFSRDARALYDAFVNAIETDLGPAGKLAVVKAFASKLPENAARIAGTLTLIKDAEAREISENTFADAITLAKYYLDEAVRLVASGMIDPELKQAETLREWLLSQPGDVIGLRPIYQFGPNSIRKAATARAAMKVLEEHGWVHPIDGGTEIDGNIHREAWRVVRC